MRLLEAFQALGFTRQFGVRRAANAVKYALAGELVWVPRMAAGQDVGARPVLAGSARGSAWRRAAAPCCPLSVAPPTRATAAAAVAPGV